MPRALLAVVACAVMTAGCKPKSAPEFYDADGRYAVLVARLGDDAYVEPEMTQIIEKLARVPASAKEGPQAQALLAKIRGEKARVDAERLAKAQVLAEPAAPPVVYPDFAPPPAPAGGPAKPAEVPLPAPGMKIEDFMANHSGCMDSAPDTEIPGEKKPGRTFMVRKTKPCTDRYGGAGSGVNKLYIFIDGKLAAEALEQETVQQVQRPPPPPVEIKGPTVMAIPGAPLPPGVVHGLPPPDPNTAGLPKP